MFFLLEPLVTPFYWAFFAAGPLGYLLRNEKSCVRPLIEPALKPKEGEERVFLMTTPPMLDGMIWFLLVEMLMGCLIWVLLVFGFFPEF